jgi:gliding motility-associated-like protein
MVRLIALKSGCADTLTKQRYVYIKPAVAKFKADFGCANPFLFSFDNFSIGADNWTWDFGDGSRSAALNPVHLYSDTGTYSVSLTANNLTTGCGYYKSKVVKVVKLHPGFYASDSVLCKKETVRFTATVSSAEVSRFTWDFGDGTIESSRDNDIEHTYEQPGNYTVKLITINLVNCRDTVVKTNYINVNGLKANFGTAVSLICANNAVVFTDSSITSGNNSIQSWQWDYGDGRIETTYAAPFAHVYTGRGNFAVSLKVTDNKGCTDTHVAELPLTVKKVSAFFGAMDTIRCTQSTVGFVCPYAEPGVTYRWNFGDGSSATQQYSSHSYNAAGVYTVKLNVKQGACEDSSMRVGLIRIENPVANFIMSDSFRTCPPLIIQFTSQSVNGINESWDFGDGSTTNTHNPSHFYSYPGIYTATLTVNGRGGCISKMQKQIVVKGPKGSLSYTPLNFCKPGDAGFTAHTADAVSYVWDFNDGFTAINADSVITHRYTNPGKYIPRLMLTDNQGCKVPVMGRDTINIVQLEPRFEFANNTVCSQEHVAFVNTTSASESIINYQWSFGDGFNAVNTEEPTHDYQAAGLYYPSLIVTTASGCTDSFTTAVPVKVAALPNATIQSPANGCTPFAAAFTAAVNAVSAPVVSWEWDFGNGNTAVQQNPSAQVYHNAGNYTIKLKVTSDEGCEQLLSKTIDAYPLPQLQFAGNAAICKGTGTTITVSGANTLVWDAAPGLACTNCASVLATPLVTTSYTVSGSNNFGCTAKDTVTVKVIQPFAMHHPANTALCAGKSATLSAQGADSYEWSPAAGLTDVHAASPVAQPASSVIYTVIGKDNYGCFTDTAFVTVTVNAAPVVDAGIDKSIASGASLELVPVVSADVTQLRWSPTDGVFRNSGNAITVKPTASTEYTVEVKNAAGCSATDKVTVTVTQNAAGNVFIPNTFSPNGDGSNDVFYPRASGSVRINKFKIVNREGVTVFEKNNFYTNDAASGWDGTLRGMMLPSDVYIYVTQIIDGNGKPYLLSGNVSLLR